VIKTEDEAFSDHGFSEAWETLFNSCPWAAPAQSFDFVSAWYEIYRERFSPVLVIESAKDGALTGVLPLALSRDNGRLVVAGASQGEYKTWLSLADNGAFIAQALLLIRKEFPGKTLAFHFLPPEAPLDFLAQNDFLKSCCTVRRYRRPLLVLDERNLTESLRKKSTKSRINRLKALGEMTFERIMTPSEAEPLMAEIGTQCDLRHGSAHDTLVFRDDPFKARLYVTLLNKPDVLHFTVMKVGGAVVSAHFGLIDKKKSRVQNGVFTHSLSHARHSPGKIHVLMLGLRLLKDGFSVFDLTPPGGDWKERFASTHDSVYELTMCGRRTQRWSPKELLITASTIGRSVFESYGLEPTNSVAPLKNAARNAWRVAGYGVVGNLKRVWFRKRPARLYRYEFAANRLPKSPDVLSRDRLDDLLAFKPKRRWWMNRQEFLSNACERLEKGHHCYTSINDRGSLLDCAWLVERHDQALLSDLSSKLEIPKKSALLVPSDIDPQTRDIASFEGCVRQMLRDAMLIPDTQYAYISVPIDDRPALRAIEKLDFVPVISSLVKEEHDAPVSTGQDRSRRSKPSRTAPREAR
jgi:CelD/BcsL family acetyltransferase involved in cellulose biosynthesis